MTRRQIQRAIDEERANIAKAKAAIVQSEARVVALDRLLSLHSDGDRSSLNSKMQLEDAAGKKKGTKISARLTRKETEARTLLLKADKTPADIATELSALRGSKKIVARSTVQAWLDGRNGVPKDARDHMRIKYGIPDSAWEKRQD